MVVVSVRRAVPTTIGPSVPHQWQLLGSARHPCAGALRSESGPPATAVLLGTNFLPGDFALLVEGVARARRNDGPLVLIHQGAGGGSLLSVAAKEEPGLTVRVIDLPARPSRSAVAHAIVAAGADTAEVSVDDHGVHLHSWHPIELPPWEPWRSDGAVVVTGGLGGLGLRAAIVLSRVHGLHPVLVDTSPAAPPPRAGHLTALHADVTDPDGLKAALSTVERPIVAFVHCAGTLFSRRVRDLTADDLAKAAAAKVTGFHNVLDLLDPSPLRHVVAFGSVTAHDSHLGMGAYGLANELLRRTARHRAVVAEWSLWSGAGLAHELGAVSQARRMGITPIPLRDGMRTLLRLFRLPFDTVRVD